MNTVLKQLGIKCTFSQSHISHIKKHTQFPKKNIDKGFI